MFWEEWKRMLKTCPVISNCHLPLHSWWFYFPTHPMLSVLPSGITKEASPCLLRYTYCFIPLRHTLCHVFVFCLPACSVSKVPAVHAKIRATKQYPRAGTYALSDWTTNNGQAPMMANNMFSEGTGIYTAIYSGGYRCWIASLLQEDRCLCI